MAITIHQSLKHGLELPPGFIRGKLVLVNGRGLHSSTFRLNVSTFCWIRWVHDFPLVYQTGGHGEV